MHAGEVEGGHCVGHGKTEAYFFPPLDVPPYNLTLGSSSGSSVKTRLGLRPDVERKQVSRVLCTALSSPSLTLLTVPADGSYSRSYIVDMDMDTHVYVYIFVYKFFFRCWMLCKSLVGLMTFTPC